MPTKISKLLEELSRRLENRNEAWQRSWLEIKAKEQKQDLQCPECDAFVPILNDTFDNGGRRICLICKTTFVAEEY